MNPKFVLPDKHTEQVFNALTENPELMQGLHNVIETLDQRGIKLDREPTVAQMWQMFKDKEVVDSLKSRTPPPSPYVPFPRRSPQAKLTKVQKIAKEKKVDVKKYLTDLQ
jgi:hypothetical protein